MFLLVNPQCAPMNTQQLRRHSDGMQGAVVQLRRTAGRIAQGPSSTHDPAILTLVATAINDCLCFHYPW